MKRKVHWDDEENGESEMKPLEEASETDVSDDKQSNDEEPRIKDVLENLSKTVSRKRASDLLHSLAASKDILFWTPRGQLLRNQRIIPVTNISELVEYVLLPHNDEVIKPRALKSECQQESSKIRNKRQKCKNPNSFKLRLLEVHVKLFIDMWFNSQIDFCFGGKWRY